MKKNSRIAEIDALRGLAVIAMVFYHLIYDLVEFYKYPLAMDHPLMRIATFAAPLFFILAGISSQFSRNPWKQIIKLILAALLITIVTFWQDPTFFVKFGTLHFLACSMILLVPLKKTPNYILVIAMIVVIWLGSLINHQSTSFSWLFPFGLRQSSFQSSDYYPLIPYFVYPMLGVLLARFFYPARQPLLPNLHLPLLQWMGRYSLWIYLLHQPILLFVLYLWHLQ